MAELVLCCFKLLAVIYMSGMIKTSSGPCCNDLRHVSFSYFRTKNKQTNRKQTKNKHSSEDMSLFQPLLRTTVPNINFSTHTQFKMSFLVLLADSNWTDRTWGHRSQARSQCKGDEEKPAEKRHHPPRLNTRHQPTNKTLLLIVLRRFTTRRNDASDWQVSLTVAVWLKLLLEPEIMKPFFQGSFSSVEALGCCREMTARCSFALSALFMLEVQSIANEPLSRRLGTKFLRHAQVWKDDKKNGIRTLAVELYLCCWQIY